MRSHWKSINPINCDNLFEIKRTKGEHILNRETNRRTSKIFSMKMHFLSFTSKKSISIISHSDIFPLRFSCRFAFTFVTSGHILKMTAYQRDHCILSTVRVRVCMWSVNWKWCRMKFVSSITNSPLCFCLLQKWPHWISYETMIWHNAQQNVVAIKKRAEENIFTFHATRTHCNGDSADDVRSYTQSDMKTTDERLLPVCQTKPKWIFLCVVHLSEEM